MRKFIFVAILVSIAIFQMTALNSIRIFGAKPEFLLITVIFFALKYGGRLGFWAGIICGLLQDSLSGLPFGAATISFSLCGFVIGNFNKTIFRESKLVQILLVLISCFFFYLVYYGILNNKLDILDFEMPVTKMAVSSIYTSVASPVFILILGKINQFLNKRFYLYET